MSRARAQAPIQATLRPGRPALREAEVELRFPAGTLEAGGVLALPAWTPGSYMVRDHARLLDRFQAMDGGGRRLETPKLDKQRWRIPPTSGPVVVRYRLLCDDFTVRTNHLDAAHAQFIGAATFLGLEGEEGRAWKVRFEGWPADWRVATALSEAKGAFIAQDYDTLVDSPFELGTFETRSFEERGARFELVVTGPHRVDLDRLVEDTGRIVSVCADLFGGFPFERYVFLLTFTPGGRGGLEHRDSTSLLADPHKAATPEGFRDLLLLIAHEFFHAWNVKRLRAPELGPFDYGRECPTPLLWFHEGCTSFLQHVILMRAGLVPWSWCARKLGALWTEYTRRPGRLEQSLEASSWDAWIRFYKPDAFAPNTTVSYYDKGALVAWMMDARIRLGSGGEHGLEALFQCLWERFGDGTVTDADLREAFQALSREPAAPFWDAWISGTEELDPAPIESAYGLRFQATAPWEHLAPEEAEDPLAQARARAYTGLVLSGDAPVVANVLPSSPAERAGLSFGMEVLAVEGWRTAKGADVQARLADAGPGGVAEVLASDRGRIRTFSVALAEDPRRDFQINAAPGVTEVQDAAFRRLTGQPHPAAVGR